MGTIETDEVFGVASSKELAETGGGHNQKGVDFQRAWALAKMFELAQDDSDDFLFLFESVQDVAILDNELNPTKICIYQVKKKDRNEWKWRDLTGLLEPKKKTSKPTLSSPKKSKKLATTGVSTTPEMTDSPVGKLYRSIIAFKSLASNGVFISNSGCDLPLKDGTNLATSLPRNLSDLTTDYHDLLIKGLEELHTTQPLPAKPELIRIEKVAIHPDAPITYLVGLVTTFLSKRSPTHTNQASSLVDALMARVSPLGRKTDSCSGFNELRKERGYSRRDFLQDIGTLEELPDQAGIFNILLNQLHSEKVISFILCVSISPERAKIVRKQLFGLKETYHDSLCSDCDKWVETHKLGSSVSDFILEALVDLKILYPKLNDSELIAYLLLRAALKCVDQISEN